MTALWEDAGEKARTGRFPTQKAQTEQRAVLLPLLNTEQLREKCSWKRHRSPGLCHRRLWSPVSHPSPCSAGLGTGTSHPRQTHLPSSNKFFSTMYKEMQMVPPATTLMAPLGTPVKSPGMPAPPDAVTPAWGPGPHHDMPPAAVCPRMDTRTCWQPGSRRARGIFSCLWGQPGPP